MSNDILTNGRRTLECIAKQWSMPENSDQKETVDFYATKTAYSFAQDEDDVAKLINHYTFMRKEYAKHDFRGEGQ